MAPKSFISVTTAASRTSCARRSRKMPTPSRCRPTRADTTNTSRTWSTCCAEKGVEHIRVVVGGGGTIAPHEIEALERYGVERIYTPEDGRRIGLDGMIDDVFARTRRAQRAAVLVRSAQSRAIMHQLARAISALEESQARRRRRRRDSPRDRQGEASRAGHRSDRHGRRRQVEPQRRAAAALRAQLSRTARSRSSRWIRRGVARAARCWAIAFA